MNWFDTAERQAIERRFDGIGWGLFFLLLGAIALPAGPLEYGAMAIVGGLLIMLNIGRMLAHVETGGFSIVLGIWAVIGGGSGLAGLNIDAAPLFFAIIGSAFLVSALAPNRPRHETLQDA